MMDFAAQYSVLEVRWRALADKEGTVYVPNPMPAAPVDYLLVAMEPMSGFPDAELRAKVTAGYRGFLRTQEDFILHWCIREYLLGLCQTYHITDISKGAMRTKEANRDRVRRWERWWPSLAAEIALLRKPGGATKIIAVGEKVEQFLINKACRPRLQILHFSPSASGARKNAIVGYEEEFEQFAQSLTWGQICKAAIRAMTEAGVPKAMRQELLERLPPALNRSQKQLAFTYKRAFTGAFA
jgi:hypothetical protein